MKNRMKNVGLFLYGRGRQVGVALLLLCVVTAHGQRKKRVAVLSFEMGPDAVQIAERLGASGLGLTLSNLLVNELGGSGKVQIVERTALDEVLKQQNYSNSDRMDPTTAAKIGKLVGVDDILICSVTQFVGSTQETGGSKFMAQISQGKPTAHQMETKVTILTTARLVDVNTGVVVATAQGSGEAKRTVLQVPNGANGQVAGNPVLNEATLIAIKSMANKLDALPVLTDTVAVERVAYTASVADTDGKTLILDTGTKGGIKVGDVVQISRLDRTIKDKNGETLKTLYKTLGTATVTEVDSKSATVTYSGADPVKIGDTARYNP